MPDRIRVSGLRVVGRHGVLASEKTSAQPFSIDLELEVDLSVAGETDRLSDTVDYGEIALIAARVVEEESHDLLERVAYRIADRVLEHVLVQTVEVTLTKLRPPIPADIAGVAVTIRRP